MQYREGEEEQVRFRAKRIFNVEDKYFFNTREGSVVGPFRSEASAKNGVSLYIKIVTTNEVSGAYASKIAMQGLWAQTRFS